MQFLNPDEDALVAIEKTGLQRPSLRDDTVLYADQAVSYPRPFLFTVQPLDKNRNYQKFSCILCLYDMAGESSLPGEDTAIKPDTPGIWCFSLCSLFLFDPTQDPAIPKCMCRSDRAIRKCRVERNVLVRERAVRQETILAGSGRSCSPLYRPGTKREA